MRAAAMARASVGSELMEERQPLWQTSSEGVCGRYSSELTSSMWMQTTQNPIVLMGRYCSCSRSNAAWCGEPSVAGMDCVYSMSTFWARAANMYVGPVETFPIGGPL